jgi:hypothetical protein
MAFVSKALDFGSAVLELDEDDDPCDKGPNPYTKQHQPVGYCAGCHDNDLLGQRQDRVDSEDMRLVFFRSGGFGNSKGYRRKMAR